jgi:hypothetical protein
MIYKTLHKRHFQQYFSYIVAVSFIGGGNRTIQRKPQTLSHHVLSTPPYEHGSNSQS